MMYNRMELDNALAATGLLEHDEFKEFAHKLREHSAWTMYNNKTVREVQDLLLDPAVFDIAIEGLFMLYAELAQYKAVDIKYIYESFVSSPTLGSAGQLSRQHSDDVTTDIVYELMILLTVYR